MIELAGRKRGPAGDDAGLRLVKGKLTKEQADAIEARKPPAGRVTMPSWLSTEAKNVWKRLAPELVRQRILRPAYVDSFAQFCEAAAIAKAAAKVVARDGILVHGEKHDAVKNPAIQVWRDATTVMGTLGARFGLTAADRENLVTEEAPPDAKGAERFFTA